MHGTELIRLQCYEGLDQHAAIYEWNYQRQLLAIKAHEGAGEAPERVEERIFSETYLLRAPAAGGDPAGRRRQCSLSTRSTAPTRSSRRSCSSCSPTSRSRFPSSERSPPYSIPRVVLTSNGTRELSDALRRRCLYHHLDFPEIDREARILLARLPGIDVMLAEQIARMVAAIRKEDLRKVPGIAETIDWAATLVGLEVHDMRQEPEAVQETLICLLKTQEDRARVTREVTERLLGKVA